MKTQPNNYNVAIYLFRSFVVLRSAGTEGANETEYTEEQTPW
jgi:hypothetical protein